MPLIQCLSGQSCCLLLRGGEAELKPWPLRRVRGMEHAIKYTCPPPLIPQSYKRRLVHSALSLITDAAQEIHFPPILLQCTAFIINVKWGLCSIFLYVWSQTKKLQNAKKEEFTCPPHCLLASLNHVRGVWSILLCLQRSLLQMLYTPFFQRQLITIGGQNHGRHCLPQDWLTFRMQDVWLLDKLINSKIVYFWHGTIGCNFSIHRNQGSSCNTCNSFNSQARNRLKRKQTNKQAN